MKIENNKLINVENRDIINGNFIIPAGITSIETSAFSNCKSLKKLTIPNGVIKIGDAAFNLCKFLENITISDSVKYIGNSTFLFCNELKNINIYSYETFNLLDEGMKLKTALSTLKNYYNNKIEYTKEDIEKFIEYVKIHKAIIKEYMLEQDDNAIFVRFAFNKLPCRKLDMDTETIHILLFKMDDFMTQEEALELLEKSNDNEIRAMLLEYNKKFKVDPFEKFNLDDDFDDNKKYYKK